MGIAENWLAFVNMSKAKADSHAKAAQYWDTTHNICSITMIVFSTLTTLATLLVLPSPYIATVLGAVTTLVSAISGTLAPSSRRQLQMESSKGFRALMLKMIRVETERDYEEIWREYNKELFVEPFVPFSFIVKLDTKFTKTPEFTMVVKQKENEVKEVVEELGLPVPEKRYGEMTVDSALVVPNPEWLSKKSSILRQGTRFSMD